MEGLHRGPETPPEAFPISVPGSGRNRAGKQKGNGESEARRGKGGRERGPRGMGTRAERNEENGASTPETGGEARCHAARAVLRLPSATSRPKFTGRSNPSTIFRVYAARERVLNE